ncbi:MULTISPECIES: hypothetical protein [Haloferacaceae]|uniref:Tat (Twin-arginine translocation) pathway signal sequence n=1 Tax=Halogeometricum luteum TaxID=2950537 RepID=A0ABU2G7R8_9EURY|nr:MULTISPECIES: hypothetical protein [Haloferacales]MDS0296840.1 hypothetical protein [Halogeometricum sp. S3BR5-2]
MSSTVQRREFLTALGAGTAGLSGCVGNLPGSGDGVDRTIYVGGYHWGFVIIGASLFAYDVLKKRFVRRDEPDSISDGTIISRRIFAEGDAGSELDND